MVLILEFTAEKASKILSTCVFTSSDFMAEINVISDKRKVSLCNTFILALKEGRSRILGFKLSLKLTVKSFSSRALLRASFAEIVVYLEINSFKFLYWFHPSISLRKIPFTFSYCWCF